jgi:uncharacterized membrane protein
MVKRREDLTTPRGGRRIDVTYDSDAFGRFSESIARYFGTARFLAIQTVIVFVWIVLNVAVVALQWDPYPFILLNLAFSTQAAYAAPLILLAQNRQEARDRVQAEVDRSVADRTQADTEFLAREIAGVRLMLADAVTGDELREQLADLKETLEGLDRRVAEMRRQATTGDDSPTTTSLEAR